MLRGDQAQAAATFRADGHIEGEDARQQRRQQRLLLSQPIPFCLVEHTASYLSISTPNHMPSISF